MTSAEYKYTDEEPLNREPEIEDLLSSFITKKDAYNRNHSVIPQINAANHILHIDGFLHHPLTLTIDNLRSNFAQHEVLSALQCAGNRRHTMRTEIKEVQGIDWFDGAVMNCTWRGPKLRDILLQAGIGDAMVNEKGYKGHVAFACYEKACQDEAWYGGSVPLERIMNEDADCILALEMNGNPLTAAHGAPLRVIVPGVLGARSVKWLNRITLQLDHSQNFYQQRDYKILPPEAIDSVTAEKFWDLCPPMLDMPVNSIIGLPKSGTTVRLNDDGCVEVKGYAVPAGMHGPIEKVEVSSDGGETWIEARLDYGSPSLTMSESQRKKVRWAWCLWTARVWISRGSQQRIVSRATDFAGNTQCEKGVWNLRGVGYNAWGEVKYLNVV